MNTMHVGVQKKYE